MVRPRFLILSRYFLDPGLVNYYKTTMSKLRSLVFAAFLALPFGVVRPGRILSQIAPPPMPVYEQPALSGCRLYLDSGLLGLERRLLGLLWVPGVWVPPPRVGLLWTPGWWGWNNGAYAFNQGYWGPLSVFTEALITDMAIPETGTGAADGVETTSSTTPL